MLKKNLMSLTAYILVIMMVLSFTSAYASADTGIINAEIIDVNDVENVTYSGYFLWKQEAAYFQYVKYVSNWILYDYHTPTTNGQTFGMIFNHGQKGTISVGISVPGLLFGGSLTYTPGTTKTISGTATSQPLNAGVRYKAEYKKKELVYDILQKEYWREPGFPDSGQWQMII